jgi:flagellar basal body rod protein FlgB
VESNGKGSCGGQNARPWNWTQKKEEKKKSNSRAAAAATSNKLLTKNSGRLLGKNKIFFRTPDQKFSNFGNRVRMVNQENTDFLIFF